MSGEFDMADDRTHRATQENLPWLLNGTLGGAALEAAQAHLHACTACRADLAALRRLRGAGRSPDPHCDPERALAQLLTRIDGAAQLAPETSAPAAPAPGAAGIPWLARARCAANDPRWLRRALLAKCGVIMLLAALLALPGEALDGWRALGAAPAAGGQAVVVFRPETSERELRRIVRESGARIVDGPTVTDAWVLALPERQRASSLARLRAAPAVLLAEPLAPEGRP